MHTRHMTWEVGAFECDLSKSGMLSETSSFVNSGRVADEVVKDVIQDSSFYVPNEANAGVWWVRKVCANGRVA